MEELDEDADIDVDNANKSFFPQEDKYKILQLICVVTTFNKDATTTTNDKVTFEVEKLLSPFQEQPLLLSPHILELITPLCNQILIIAELYGKNEILVCNFKTNFNIS